MSRGRHTFKRILKPDRVRQPRYYHVPPGTAEQCSEDLLRDWRRILSPSATKSTRCPRSQLDSSLKNFTVGLIEHCWCHNLLQDGSFLDIITSGIGLSSE